MADWVRTRLHVPSVGPRLWVATRPIDAALIAVLIVALVTRLLGLDRIEPNILADEADHLRLIYQIGAGNGPWPFDLAPDGSPAAAVYPAVPVHFILGPSYLVLRATSALASLLSLLLFYGLARQTLSQFPSLAATALLAFNVSFLFFSRNGLLDVWVVACALAAALATTRAFESSLRRDWLFAGICCGLGWYTEPTGTLILPSMLLYLLLAGLAQRERARAALEGAGVLLVVSLTMLVPRLLALIAGWPSLVEQLRGYSVLSSATPLSALGAQILNTIRSLVLLDASVPHEARYLAPGMAILDSFTATLYFVGLVLGLARFRRTTLWWALLLPPLVLHSLGRSVPDPGIVLLALPAMMLFAGLTAEWLTELSLPRDLVRLALALSVGAAVFWSWTHYVEWQQSPGNAAARQPALELAEFPVWQALQLAEAHGGQPGFSLAQWQVIRGSHQSAIAAAAREASSSRFATGVEFRALDGLSAIATLKKPRGAVLASDGGAYILDADGRLMKVDQKGAIVRTFGRETGGPAAEEAADLALAQDGSLLVLDAGRGMIDRYLPDGSYAGTLGSGWGTYRPRGLAVGPDGKIYVADTGRSRVLVSTGGPPEREIKDLGQVTDVAVDERGLLYVVEPESSRIRVLDLEGRTQTSWEIARTNTVEGPHLTALEGGALAVTDPARRRVVFYDPRGRQLAQIGEGEPTFSLPYGISASGNRLIMTDAGRPAVRVYELTVR